MRRNEWPAAIDCDFPIGFERIGRVVELDVKEKAQKSVGRSVYQQLQLRIIDDRAATHKSASENAIESFVQFFPITNHVAAVIRFIRHHNNHGVAFHFVEPPNHCSSIAWFRFVLQRSHLGDLARELA